MGSIPPNKAHPLYDVWIAASSRYLAAQKKLAALAEADPEYPAVHSECEVAWTAYEAILLQIIEQE